MENIKKISIDGWKLFSQRRNSKNYVSKDNKYVLKVFSKFTNVSITNLVKSIEITNHILDSGISTPKVYEIVSVNGELGLIYENIENKISVSKAIYQDPRNKEIYLAQFANFTKHVHSSPADTSFFESFVSRVEKGLETLTNITQKQRRFILNKLHEYPDTKTYLFHDYQYSNVLIANTKNYAIDLGTFCYGNPIFDLGFLYSFSFRFQEAAREHVLHMNGVTAENCFDIFLRKYYPELDDKSLKEKKEEIRIISIIPFIAILTHLNVKDDLEKILPSYFKDEVGID